MKPCFSNPSNTLERSQRLRFKEIWSPKSLEESDLSSIALLRLGSRLFRWWTTNSSLVKKSKSTTSPGTRKTCTTMPVWSSATCPLRLLRLNSSPFSSLLDSFSVSRLQRVLMTSSTQPPFNSWKNQWLLSLSRKCTAKKLTGRRSSLDLVAKSVKSS